MDWFLVVLKKYAVFGGRARRKEYWMFYLIYLIIVVVLSMVEMALGLYGMLAGLFSLALLIPSIAVGVRRLHDINKSAWMLLVGLIPLVGAIILLIWALQPGTQGDNDYGPDPKAGEGGGAAAATPPAAESGKSKSQT